MTKLFFGHHKCATIWIVSILNHLAVKAGLTHQHFHSHKTMGYDLKRAIADGGLDVCSYTNANYAHINVDDFRGFHVVRDPRDILVSAYFSHMKSHETDFWPELVAHRAELQALPKSEGLLYSFEFSDRLPTDGCDINLMDALGGWNYQDERILELRFEDIVAKPYETWVEVMQHLEMLGPQSAAPSKPGLLDRLARRRSPERGGLGIADVLYAVYGTRFEKKAGGRGAGAENTASHYRKGQPGDWVNHFEASHKAAFKARYPGLLEKLGYDKERRLVA